MFDFLNNPELEKQCEREWNDKVNWAYTKAQAKSEAERGDPDAVVRYFLLCAQKDISEKGVFYTGDAYTILEYFAQKGLTEPLKVLITLYAIGGLPDIGKCHNIQPSPDKALDYCKYFNEEAKEQEDVKKLIKIVEEKVEEEAAMKSSGGCYIATAVYGDYDAPEVLVLRAFRDDVLLQSIIGRLFVKVYYFVSPPLAQNLKKCSWLNSKIKKILDYFVSCLRK